MTTEEKNIHAQHRERMRNKAKKFGFEHFEDHELLEYVLFHCNQRGNTNPIAHRLLKKYKNFMGVIMAEPKELEEIKGIGEIAALFLSSLREVYKRTLTKVNEAISLRNVGALYEYCKGVFKFEKTEHLFALCLDKNYFLKQCLEISTKNSQGEAIVEIGLAFKKIMFESPQYVVLTHNHLDYNLSISPDDARITAKLYKLLNSYNIGLINHIIVCHDEVVDFEANGAMAKIKEMAARSTETMEEMINTTIKIKSQPVYIDPDVEIF